jgi:hypothetical protein
MFKQYSSLALIVVAGIGVFFYAATGIGQQRAPATPDAVEEAQTPRPPSSKRVEQEKSSQDQSDIFSGTAAPSSSPALEINQIRGKCWVSISPGIRLMQSARCSPPKKS